MPTYVYRCEKCGEFDVTQSITAPPLDLCPNCRGAVKPVISGGSGFIIRGHGSSRSRCERETPCCGRDERCDKPPCGE
jgi:putative FmdB family regulatory protein